MSQTTGKNRQWTTRIYRSLLKIDWILSNTNRYLSCLEHLNVGPVNRSSMPTTYDYYYHHHHHSWPKPNYAIFTPQSTLFPTHTTGAHPSIDMTSNKSYYPSLVDTHPTLNNSNSNFYRRHSTYRHLFVSIDGYFIVLFRSWISVADIEHVLFVANIGCSI
jgi:hypothetical protein